MDQIATLLDLRDFLSTFVGWLFADASTAVALVGLLVGLPAWILTRNGEMYSNFDSLYQDVLSKGMESPALLDPDRTRNYRNLSPQEKAAYEAYAYMVFNVCETIADGLDLYKRRRRPVMDAVEDLVRLVIPEVADRRWLQKTWRPVLVAEKALHRQWLEDQAPGVRFKKEFLDLMRSTKLHG